MIGNFLLPKGAGGISRHSNLMIAKKTLYLNSDKTKIVAENSEEAAFLLVRRGAEILPAVMKQYGLSEDFETGKAKAPAANKVKTPSENK